MTEHPSPEVLADAAEGLLDPAQAEAVRQHLAGCAACRADAEALAEVSRLLAGTPTPVVPAAVADRLSAVLVAEQQRRAQPAGQRAGRPRLVAAAGRRLVVPRHPYGTAERPHPGLRRFGADLHRVSAGRRWALPALAAAGLAAVVGFGAYVASATLGLNEPPAVSVSVRDGRAGPEAGLLPRTTDLDPHRFSQAWWCARQATEGRIVGLATTTDGGRPALLVYLRHDGASTVRVVTGCGTPDPTAGPAVPLSR